MITQNIMPKKKLFKIVQVFLHFVNCVDQKKKQPTPTHKQPNTFTYIRYNNVRNRDEAKFQNGYRFEIPSTTHK